LRQHSSESCENRATHSTITEQHVGVAATLQNGGQQTPTYIIIPEGCEADYSQLLKLVQSQVEEVDVNAPVTISSPVQQRQVVNDHVNTKPKVNIVDHQASQHPKLIQNKPVVVGKTATTSKAQLSRTATPLTKIVRQSKASVKKPLIKIDIKTPIRQIKRPLSAGRQQVAAKVAKMSEDQLPTVIQPTLNGGDLVDSMFVENTSNNPPTSTDNTTYLDENYLCGKLDFLDENLDLFKQEPYSPLSEPLSSPLSVATSNDSGAQDLFVTEFGDTYSYPLFPQLD